MRTRAGVTASERLVADVEAVLDVGPVVLDDDVGAVRQPQEHVEPGRRLQVDDGAALVAMQVLKVRDRPGCRPDPRRVDIRALRS